MTASRFRIGGDTFLAKVRDRTLEAAREAGCAIKALAIMPDHLHVALRGAVESTPAKIAVLLQNGSTRAAGCRMWEDRFYVGTFSEYDMTAV